MPSRWLWMKPAPLNGAASATPGDCPVQPRKCSKPVAVLPRFPPSGMPFRFSGSLLFSFAGNGQQHFPFPCDAFGDFFAGAVRSLAMLRRSASMRFTTFCGSADGRSVGSGIPACFFLSSATAASSPQYRKRERTIGSQAVVVRGDFWINHVPSFIPARKPLPLQLSKIHHVMDTFILKHSLFA